MVALAIEREAAMSIDCPGYGDYVESVDLFKVEAIRLSNFYKSVPSKPLVYLATNRWGRGVSYPTVVKTDAQQFARSKNGRVHVFEEGILSGYC